MAACQNCGTTLAEGLDFCVTCGQPVPTDVAVPEVADSGSETIMPPPPSGMPPPPAAAPVQPAAGVGDPVAVSADDRTWGMAAHLSALVTIVGIPSVVGPLVVWLIKKDQSPFVDANGKEAINFNISMLIYGVIAFLTIFIAIGILLLPVVLITWFVLTIMGGIKANQGLVYRYPLTIRFLN